MGDRGRTSRRVWAAVAAAVVLGGVSGPAHAADSTTRPATPAAAADDGPAHRDGRRGDGGFGGGRRFGGGPLGRGGPGISPADRSDAMLFLSQHAQNYFQTIKALPDDSDARIRLENAVARAYLGYQRLKVDDPELYDVITRRVTVEDRIYGLSVTLRANPTDALRSDLHQQVSDWCDLNLEERRLRVVRLERTLQREKDRLAADTADRQRMIDRRMSQAVNGPADGMVIGGRGGSDGSGSGTRPPGR